MEKPTYSMGIRHHVKTEQWIDGCIYTYRCRKTFEETHNNQVAR